MKMMFAVFVLFASVASAQTPVKAPEFVCPPQSKVACDSFLELRKANDPNVFLEEEGYSEGGNFGKVCFRQNADNFLVVTIGQGSYDSAKAKENGDSTMVLWREWRARGRLQSFQDGIEGADGLVPELFFSGSWNSTTAISKHDITLLKRPADANFVSDKQILSSVFNDGQLLVDETSLNITTTYKSIKGDTQYDLSIQLTTGRFKETHRDQQGQEIMVLTQIGRCIPLTKKSK